MHVVMTPNTGETLLRYIGDRVRFSIAPSGSEIPVQAFLRTNLGRASFLHAEVLQEYQEAATAWQHSAQPQSKSSPLIAQAPLPRGMALRDVSMRKTESGWEAELVLTETGFFHAKAYVVDEHGRHVWPTGSNVGITVHPNEYRTGNVVYCAFTRMFGETKSASSTTHLTDPFIERLEKNQYTVIPPSGKLRDLIREIPHIFGTLGCRFLHLLPVNPTPTTYARFGRFGSPYATEDLTAVDPALVEFDRRTTGVDQFEELTYAAHARGGRVILDIVINHTGWGSVLQENHPDWFLRRENGVFISPGAWGTTWEDLVELDHRIPPAWNYLASVFLIWCRRGVDGFRCDAGYKVPTAAWRYITAKVRHEFPNALFLLEGLGGAWEATEELLTTGGMQWAYSELFQNHSPIQVSGYIDHSIRKSETVGTLIHYSETHDNDRLAAKGRAWSTLRNGLCALVSTSGAFGYTCGVEWLASEKINVHSSTGMSWGNPENVVPELSALAALLCDHPSFFDGAKLTRISGPESWVFALARVSAEGKDRVLVLVNLDPAEPRSIFLPSQLYNELGAPQFDLLAQRPIPLQVRGDNVEIRLAPGQSFCLSRLERPAGLHGEEYRRLRALHAWAIRAIANLLEPEQIGPHDWAELAKFVEARPREFLASLSAIDPEIAGRDLMAALRQSTTAQVYPRVVEWSSTDRRRITPVPPRHWLLLVEKVPFRATLSWGELQEHAESMPFNGSNYCAFPPLDLFKRPRTGPASLRLTRFSEEGPQCSASLLYLHARPEFSDKIWLPLHPRGSSPDAPIVLLTNGRGGMARICVDLGEVKSKYDCLLGANLHPSVPVDRHIFVKRLRLWANADRFITPLNAMNLQHFSAGPPARWEFAAIAGDGQFARIELVIDMLPGENTTVCALRLLDTSKPDTAVRISARFDIEDRNFHNQTHRNDSAEHHFSSNCRRLPNAAGFELTPGGRLLRVHSSSGVFNDAPEWSQGISHTVESTRGQVGSGDAYSPGWFDIPLERGTRVFLAATSEKDSPTIPDNFLAERTALISAAQKRAAATDSFGNQLALAIQAYVVRRDRFKTIIAGYPWFLDWGRDSLICARGLISAGMIEEVKELLVVFGRFEKDGTLPNTIHGEDASNRDTTDAPLWYGIVCDELAAKLGSSVYEIAVDDHGRTIRDVLRAIAAGYIEGTPNGIRMDPASGLIWSPSHFTWMDTNYPAGTPREGYPIEIQALWIKLLQQLDRLKVPAATEPWVALAERARSSLLNYFWLPEKGWIADVLIAPRGMATADATRDDALRSNCVIPITFDLMPKPQARRCLENVLRFLVVPGALRSLAPLPLAHPLPIHGPDWRLLNNPSEPYWGRYEGDEDTQRKPAYHNGTAWTWTFPSVAEALVRAWDGSDAAKDAGKAYIGSMAHLLNEGCIGHIPEVVDGDAPHAQRGCDAQSWSVTEAFRVWQLLHQ